MAKSTIKKQQKIRKPDFFLYWLVMPVFRLLANLLVRFKVEKDKKIIKMGTPIVAIGSHTCMMDVAFMLLALSPIRLNIVCGRDVFTWKPVKPIQKAAGLLPINQFEMDLTSIRLMKKAVSSGCSIALFPEGKISLDGRPLSNMNFKSIAKLLKFLDANVVFSHNYGGYSARPRWFHGFRRGKIIQKCKILFTREELKELSVDEVYNKLKKEFTFNDSEFQQEHQLRYKSKTPAKGLNYILYKCPKCGAEYEMECDGNFLSCTACGNRVQYTEYGEFIPDEGSVTFDRLDKWYDYEKESVNKELDNPDFRLSYPVVWEQANAEYVYEEMGEGELFVDHKEIGFIGKDLQGNEVKIITPIAYLPTVVQKTQEAIDLTVNNVVNRFYFRDGKYSAKYNLIVEEAYKRI